MGTRGSSGLRKGAVALLATAALVVAGCGGGGSGGSSASGETGNSAPPAKGGTLRVADIAEAISLNPYTALDNNSVHVFAQILEPLFRTDGKGEVIPWLATGAKASDDFKTWTFELRKDVKFSDGKPMTADDVVYSLDKIRENETWKTLYTSISSVKATSPTTVVVQSRTPFPTIETNLSLPFAAIVPQDLGGKSEAEFASDPIGTGPFVLADWARGTSLTLEANPDYWDPKLPLLEKVVFDSVDADTSRALQLRGGQLDLIANPPLSQVSGLESAPEIFVGKYHLAYPDYLMFNVRSPLFSDPRVREAADLVVNRDSIVKAALSGVGAPGGSWFAPALRYHDASIKAPTPDVEKAKALLDEAVEEKGLSPEFTLKVNSGEEQARVAAQIIQENMREIGMQVTIQPFDEASLLEQVSGGDYEATIFGLTSDIMEPSEVTSFYIDLEGFWTGADTTRIEQLLESATVEPDAEKRRDDYYEIQQIVAEQKELVPLDYRYWLWAMKDSVAGFELSPTGIPWFADAGFSG